MMTTLFILLSLISLCISQERCDDEVTCFQRPCEANPCEVEGATCVDDYCGGCHARWTDADGNPVCEMMDCTVVLCAPPDCEEGTVPVVPEGKCCAVCQKEVINCAAVLCLRPDCEEGEILVTPEGQCCPMCVAAPNDCELVDCADEVCEDGEVPVSVEGACCKQCQASTIDCSLVRCAYPNCGIGEIAYQPEGQCCMACKEGCDEVNCFADPCSVSSCDVEGAVCTSNYCGGCNAIWTVNGEPVNCEKFIGGTEERTKFFRGSSGKDLNDVLSALEDYLSQRGISYERIELREHKGRQAVVVIFSTTTDADIASRAIISENADFIIVESESDTSTSLLAGLALISTALLF